MAQAKMSVLVVENEKLQNWSVSKSLTKWGFEVSSVSTGSGAVAELERSAFDVVLLDYQLPDLDGLEVARRARGMRPGARIIMVTAFQESELPAHAGLIDGYFNKPLDMQKLHRAILEGVESSRAAK